MQTRQTETAPLTDRVAAAVKADAADEIQRLFMEELIAKQRADAEQKGAAEALDLQKRLIQNRVQDLFLDRMAQDAFRQTFGDGLSSAKSFGDWFRAVLRGDRAHLKKVYGTELSAPDRGHYSRHQKAMAEASGVAGGYTVPPELVRDIMAVPAGSGFIRKYAQVAPMKSATLQYPLLDVTTAQSAGTSPFSGGLLMSWLSEALTRGDTEPAFKQLELKAWELSGVLTISNPLLQDGVNAEAYFKTIIASAVGEYEEKAFLTGDGVGKPQGILGAAATIPITRQGAGAVSFLDTSTMLGTLPPGSLEYACWTCSPTALPQLLELKDSVTNERSVVLHAGVGETPSRPRMTLGGLPLRVSQWLPALGTEGDLTLADWRYYVIGDRGLFIAGSEVPNFTKFQTSIRVVDRVDGQPWLDKSITLQDGSTKVSPFVVLN